MVQEPIKVSHSETIHDLDLVYFIQSGEFVKIGQTGSLAQRLGHFKTHNPHPMYVVGLIKGGPKEEKLLHEKFSHLHVKNEWFRYESEIKDFFPNFEPITIELLQDKLILQYAMTDPKFNRHKIRSVLKRNPSLQQIVSRQCQEAFEDGRDGQFYEETKSFAEATGEETIPYFSLDSVY